MEMIMSNFKKTVIPSWFREGITDNEITDDFISDCLQRLRSLGENISYGKIEMVDTLSNGDIEVYIEEEE